jgi:hypothetical protein
MLPTGENELGSNGGCDEGTAVNGSVNNQMSYSSLTTVTFSLYLLA